MGSFGLVKPGNPSKHSPICVLSGNTLKSVIDSVKNKIQTFCKLQFSGGSFVAIFEVNSTTIYMTCLDFTLYIFIYYLHYGAPCTIQLHNFKLKMTIYIFTYIHLNALKGMTK